MRLYSVALITISGVSLAFVYNQHPDGLTLALCLVLFSLSTALVSANNFNMLLTLAGLSLAFVFGAGYSLAFDVWWLEPPLAFAVALALAVGMAMADRWAWSKMQRAYHGELLVVSDKFVGGLQAVVGPAWVLPLPIFRRLLARLPRYQQEHELRLTRVNAHPRAGSLGMLSQNVDLLVVELVYRLLPDGHRRIFAFPNQDTLFSEAAAALRKGRRDAMLDKQFWVQVWRAALTDCAARVLRSVIHEAGLSPHEVSVQRGALAARALEQLRVEAEQLGLELLSLSFSQVETDEAEAAQLSRAQMVQAQGRAQEIELTGEAQARVRAALVREVADIVRASGGALSQRMLELIIQGVLPQSLLQTYLQGPTTELIDRMADRDGRTGRFSNGHSLN